MFDVYEEDHQDGFGGIKVREHPQAEITRLELAAIQDGWVVLEVTRGRTDETAMCPACLVGLASYAVTAATVFVAERSL